jgi:hypothetical protein
VVQSLESGGRKIRDCRCLIEDFNINIVEPTDSVMKSQGSYNENIWGVEI